MSEAPRDLLGRGLVVAGEHEQLGFPGLAIRAMQCGVDIFSRVGDRNVPGILAVDCHKIVSGSGEFKN